MFKRLLHFKYVFLLITILGFNTNVSAQSDMVISGVIDATLPNGEPKAIEFYVICDIPDLSIYGFGSANNGGGSDGEEFTFPAVSANAGDYIYVSFETSEFTTYFGFAPDYTSSFAQINGDDAIELFKDGAVVDLFGDIDVDGNGESWEYLDGWAYRNNDTGPSTTFSDTDWTFSGPNALDPCSSSTNATCGSMFPIGTHTNTNTCATDNAPNMVISGVIDATLPNGEPKAIEFYVICNIPDLSIYGFGSANNGGGSDGEEFTFPAVSANAGDYIYVSFETSEFTTYFGFAPDYTSSFAQINGDDAIELFKDGAVIDLFGDIDVDGNGESWEYLDGWAYRNNDTGPSTTFSDADWTFSGPNALDPCSSSTNATCGSMFPIGTYTKACNAVGCNISEVLVDNISTCDDNGTGDDASDDTFTFDVTVTFADAPISGSLDLSGDGTATVDVTGLDSPTSHKFIGVSGSADGGSINVVATFSDETSCTRFDDSQTAPSHCSFNPCGDLFFSEYIEGSGDSKCVEVYNPTGSDIDMGAEGYAVKIYFNGSSSAGTTINLIGTIISGGTHVVCDDGSTTVIFNKADQFSTSGFFSGDDAVELVRGSITLDVIGQIGSDPGSEWNSNGVGTQNETLRRKASVLEGDKSGGDDFDPSLEWDSYPQNNSDNLGVHVSDCISCDIDVQIEGNATFCAGESSVLDAGVYEPLANVYEWSNGEMTQILDTDIPGTYTVTVTNDAGCQGTDEITINGLTPFEVTLGSEQVMQADASGLQVYEVEICGGEFPYTLDITASGFALTDIEYTGPNCRKAIVQFDLGVDWVLYVNDSNDCGPIVIDSQDLATTDYGVLSIVTTNMTQETCPNTTDGALTIEIDGGDNSCGSYDISWTGPYLSQTGTVDVTTLPASVSLEGLIAGIYTVTITDCDGHSVYKNISVTRKNSRRGRRGNLNCPTAPSGKAAIEHASINFVELYPNPFSQTAQLEFGLSITTNVTVDIYTIDGRKAANVFDGTVEEGQNNVFVIDGSELTAGIYVLKLTTDSGVVHHEKLYIAK